MRTLRRFCWSISTLVLSASFSGCGGGTGGGSSPPPPPPSPAITVTIAPNPESVFLGETLSFSATVNNTANTAVSWSVNSISGGSAQAGTISADGLYTAPADLPPGGTVQVTATSQADPSKSATAGVTITSDISISVSPGTASVELGSMQSFHAAIDSNAKPDQAIRWSLSGNACPNSCGSVDVNGNYTAPSILPSNPSVTLTATSAADPSKQASAPFTITSHFTLQLTAPSSLPTRATSAIVATLTPVPGSNPSAVLSWTLSGSGCNGSACGILSVITAQSTGSGSIANSANYAAPDNPPQPDTVTITVTPQADPTKKAQATIAIQSAGGLSVSPSTYTLAANHRVTLTATETNATGEMLSWSVNGVPGGNVALGQLCVVSSSPCRGVTTGSATQVDYIAPGAIPPANPISVQVVSTENPVLSASAQVTVINHVLVGVFPNNITLPPLGVQGFTATVLGATNQDVVWQIQGAACGTSGACGSINPGGAFTAPAAPPSPDTIRVVALSQDDSTQSGTATISISTGANILTLHPASVYAGGADGFTLAVTGSGFVPSNPGPGSALLIGGGARVTTCGSSNSCTAPITSTDVAQPGSIGVQVKNPDGTLSNLVSLVTTVLGSTDTIVTLSGASPSSTGQTITVVEPTTAGEDGAGVSFDLNVAALGVFNTSTNACNLGGNPISILPPTSGASTADICLFSQSGFDTSMNYLVLGPTDIAVIAKQPAGLGIIHLTLQISSTAAPGARTLFIQNANLDKTAASGALEIE